VRSISEGKRGRRQDSSTVPKVNDTEKSGATARKVESGGWRSKMTKEN
jgi:hypothetical protein